MLPYEGHKDKTHWFFTREGQNHKWALGNNKKGYALDESLNITNADGRKNWLANQDLPKKKSLWYLIFQPIHVILPVSFSEIIVVVKQISAFYPRRTGPFPNSCLFYYFGKKMCCRRFRAYSAGALR